jgi:hypothetical protein
MQAAITVRNKKAATPFEPPHQVFSGWPEFRDLFDQKRNL